MANRDLPLANDHRPLSIAAAPAPEAANEPPPIQRVFYGGMPPDDHPCWGDKALKKIPCLEVGLP